MPNPREGRGEGRGEGREEGTEIAPAAHTPALGLTLCMPTPNPMPSPNPSPSPRPNPNPNPNPRYAEIVLCSGTQPCYCCVSPRLYCFHDCPTVQFLNHVTEMHAIDESLYFPRHVQTCPILNSCDSRR